MADELSIEVPRHEHGPAQSRAAVRDAFADRISPRQLEDLEVIVSELTTNALLYGSGEIGLKVLLDEGVVRGEVVDEGGGFEREVRVRGIDAVGGNGLEIVGAMTQEWGIHEGSSHVWFELAPGAPPTPDDPQLGPEERPDALDQ